MSETKGQFVQGKWVETPEAAAEGSKAASAAPDVDALTSEAHKSVQKAMDDILRLGRHLIGTPEGREHIEKRVIKAGEDLGKTINEAALVAKKKLSEGK